MNQKRPLLLLLGLLLAIPACGGVSIPAGTEDEPGRTAGSGAAGGDSDDDGRSSAGGGERPAPEWPDDPEFPDNGVQAKSDRLDILFVVDNSSSMADKQALLATVTHRFLSQVADPPCLDDEGREVGTGNCPPGSARRGVPVTDIHAGVVSTSLGDHGGTICGERDPVPDATQRDNAHLIATRRDHLTSYENSGFLKWDPLARANPPGMSDVWEFVTGVADMLTSAGEEGCGYEAPLEAWYRFLIDPEPPARVRVEDNVAVPEGVDEVVLEQRDRFLRPDSSLMIVMLTDENDCSVKDSGLGWLTTDTTYTAMPRSTSQCKIDPSDPCCRPCARVPESEEEVAACGPREQDPECRINSGFLTPSSSAELPPDGSVDHHNLRCFQQKRRFGMDLLYPVSRYVDALTKRTLRDSAGRVFENPLFSGGRNPSLVTLASITGVPWQDVATEQSLERPDSELRYLRGLELEREGVWALVLGDPQRNVPPRDPFMVESVVPRNQLDIPQDNPRTGEFVVPPTAVDPNANAINGHEHLTPDYGNLQHACIFPLNQPRNCAETASCDCTEVDLPNNSALCNPPDGGVATTTQHAGKAYPAVRQLEVLRGIGQSAVLASICPRAVDLEGLKLGYEPAIQAITERLFETMR